MLSLKRYRWLCVLGAEVAYFVCLLETSCRSVPQPVSSYITQSSKHFQALSG
jgi:hypothetical protein